MVFDWTRALKAGEELAREDRRIGNTPEGAMWALLRDAFRVSRFYSGPPRSYYPQKSSMPDAPDEVTHFQKVAAWLRGELEDEPEWEPSPVWPSAEECTRAQHVLDLFHAVTSAWGTNSTRRRSVAALAMGLRRDAVMHRYGLTRREIELARTRATSEMAKSVQTGQ